MWEQIQLHARVTAPPGVDVDKEWLVTNGIGGFASGTVSGRLTRRYHGWLIASLKPPVQRTLLWAKCDEQVIVGAERRPLSTNDYGDVFHPDGWRRIESFRLYPFPTTVFRVGALLLERILFMIRGQNTTVVLYRLLAGPPAVELVVEPLVNCRDYHHVVRANEWSFRQNAWRFGTEIRAYTGAPPLVLAAGVQRTTGLAPRPDKQGGGVDYVAGGEWHYRFHYFAERERGLDFVEDHFKPGSFRFLLGGPGDVAVLVGHCPVPAPDREPPWREGPAALAAWGVRALERAAARRERLVGQAAAVWSERAARHRPAAGLRRRRKSGGRSGARFDSATDPDWRRLVLAADDFVVRRQTTGCATVVAGYPWFTDWGRDAFISLPGLLLATGRWDDAREVLLTFADHRTKGLIPNRFPDDAGEPVYNAVDASLWWICAAWRYWRATGDEAFKCELYRIAADVLRSYMRGTLHNIGIDADGLVHAADPGLQLTWMDAKVGDWVVTPRHGAPVEVNALWYNALRAVGQWAERCAPGDVGFWRRAAQDVRRAFLRRFVRADGRLYDVVPSSPASSTSAGAPGEKGGDVGADATVRPNQLLAASLPFPVLDKGQTRRVVLHAAAALLTPVGLRTLPADHPAYEGVYVGNQRERDAAYHQGTVWPWLLGPYVTAARRCGLTGRNVSDDLFGALRAHLRGEAALGHVSEIFDGNAPHAPRGCFAQAWSVAEWLRVWSEAAD